MALIARYRKNGRPETINSFFKSHSTKKKIPTCVENSTLHSSLNLCLMDHPHVRGKFCDTAVSDINSDIDVAGSSPHEGGMVIYVQTYLRINQL